MCLLCTSCSSAKERAWSVMKAFERLFYPNVCRFFKDSKHHLNGKMIQHHLQAKICHKNSKWKMRRRKNLTSQMKTRKKLRLLSLTSVLNWKLFHREMSRYKKTELKEDFLKGPLDWVVVMDLDLVDSMDQDIHWGKPQAVMMLIKLLKMLAAGDQIENGKKKIFNPIGIGIIAV